jgi:O-antigen biosynthesis protein
MKLLPLHAPWSALVSRTGTIRLRSHRPLDRSWYLIRVRTAGLSSASAPLLKKANHGGGSHLIPGRRLGEWELVFFHARPLSALQLELPDAAQGADIRISIIPVGTPGAIIAMARAVSYRDRGKGIDSTRIYRKSWARWRQHGWAGFLHRLVREYQPQEILSVLAGDPYGKWIETVEAPEWKSIGSMDPGARQPLISVILAIGTTPEYTLRKTIESVLTQSYSRLELCIAVDALSPHSGMAQRDAARDPRIRLGTSRQEALGLATGEFVTWLDAGDELARHALLAVAQTIDAYSEVGLLYSDEDRIDREGRRFAPIFKPDWNPDLFLSRNYLAHLCVIRRPLPPAGAAVATEEPAAGHYALLLRGVARLRPEQIVHMPKVLYHRRARAKENNAPDPLLSLEPLRHYFAEMGRNDIMVETGLVPGTHRVRYPLPQPAPLVSLIIPTRDRLELIETCVRSILDKTSYGNFEILILDNQSEDEATLEFFGRIQEEDARVRVLRYEHPFNYSAINNYGVRHAAGELIGLINNDIEVITPDWLSEMVGHACRPEIGCVGAKLYYPNNTIQHAGVIIGLWGVAGHTYKHFPRCATGYGNGLLVVQNCSAVTAACLLVRRSIYEQVGGLDERNLPVSFNDVDFCLKVRRAGYRNLWTPYAELYHHESVSRGRDDTPEKKARELREIAYMKATWAAELAHDPCYSPHLTRHREDFSINLDHILYTTVKSSAEDG